MKLHGIWKIKRGLCILPFFRVEAKQFWYGVLVHVFGICFDDVLVYVKMYIDVNTSMSYVIELK